MAVIDNFRGIITVFTEYKADGKESMELLQELKDVYTDHSKDFPGLVSINLHVSLESNSVFNYSQWKTEEDFKNFEDSKAFQKALKKIDGLTSSSDKTKVVFAS